MESSEMTPLLQDSLTPGSGPGSWLSPYSGGVWVVILLLYLLTCLVLTLLSRTSPHDSPLLVTDSAWYLSSCWFRGSSYRPQAHSTRLVSCCWWIFILVIILTFFTQLPAHLARQATSGSRHRNVASVLENVDNIGVVEGGSTYQLLQVTCQI